MRRALVAAFFLSIAGAPRVARAQSEADASRLFHEGEKAFDAHEYRRAAESFEDADRAKHAGAALLSAAIAWEFAGDLVHAANDFDAAIGARDLDEKQNADATSRLASVDAKLARVDIRGGANDLVAVDGAAAFSPLPFHVRLAPGSHSFTFRFPEGRVERRDVVLSAGATTIDAEAAPTPPPASPSPHEETRASDGSTQRTLGWIGVGVGGAVLVTGVVVGLVGLGARNSFEDSGDVDASLHDRAITMRTAADVLLIGGAVVAGAGAVLLLTAPKGGPSVTVGISGVRFSGCF